MTIANNAQSREKETAMRGEQGEPNDWTSSIGYSMIDIDNSDGQDPWASVKYSFGYSWGDKP